MLFAQRRVHPPFQLLPHFLHLTYQSFFLFLQLSLTTLPFSSSQHYLNPIKLNFSNHPPFLIQLFITTKLLNSINHFSSSYIQNPNLTNLSTNTITILSTSPYHSNFNINSSS